MVQSITLPPAVRGQWLPMTYEQFLDWAPEGFHTEWTDGEGITYVSTSDRHQALVLLIATVLESLARVFDLGRVSIAPYPVLLWPGGPHREPDVLFVAKHHLDRWTERRFEGPADLLFEMLSEDTAREDRGRKRQQYETAGNTEYVMLDARPGRHEFIYLRLDEAGRYLRVEPDARGHYHSTVLPGFWLDPAWFQHDPLPNPMTILRRISPEAWRRLVEEVEAEA